MIYILLLILCFIANHSLDAFEIEINKKKQNSRGRICFQDHDADMRGTTLAIYDYADYAEKLLHYESVILIPNFRKHLSPAGLTKYTQRFNVVFYGEHRQIGGKSMVSKARELKCNVVFIAKSGGLDTIPAFPESYPCDLNVATIGIFTYSKQGTTCAALNKGMLSSNDIIEMPNIYNHLLPHVVRPPPTEIPDDIGSYKEDFKIANSTLVLCRHGGKQTFNIPFAHFAIKRLINKYSAEQLQFIFLHTQVFENLHNHPQVHFISDHVTSSIGKEKFFKSCDGMIHARRGGETFGLAISEFSARNKPVITYKTTDNHPSERFHTDTLGDQAFIYSDEDSLIAIVSEMVEKGIPNKQYDAYTQFQPEKVMKIFDEIMIRPILDNNLTSYHLKNKC